MKKIVTVDTYSVDKTRTVEYENESDEFEVREKAEGKGVFTQKEEFLETAMRIDNTGLYLLTSVDLRPTYAPTLKDKNGKEPKNRSTSILVDENGSFVASLPALDGMSDKALAKKYFAGKKSFVGKVYDGLAAYMGKHLDEVENIPVDAFSGRETLAEEILTNAQENVLGENNGKPLSEKELTELKQSVEAAKGVFEEKEKALAAKENLKSDVVSSLTR